MPKKGQGKAKNTVNKAKHSKLMTQKNNKLKLKKQLQKILAENQRNEFGKPVDHKDSLDKIDVRIKGTFKGWDKGLVVTLDNGQKWRVISNSRGYTKLSSPKAVIERAFFGSYKMRVEGYTPVAKVKRVK